MKEMTEEPKPPTMMLSEEGECCGNCARSSPTGNWYVHCDLFDADIMIPRCMKNFRCMYGYNPKPE